MNSFIAEKIYGLRRCVSRAREELARAGSASAHDLMHQDAAVFNVVRAYAAANNLAAYLVMQLRLNRLTTNEDVFHVLCGNQIISESLCASFAFLADFRSTALRASELDPNIVIDVIQHRLDDVLAFADIVLDLSD